MGYHPRIEDRKKDKPVILGLGAEMEEFGLAFNRIAEDYDRYREAYPTEYIESVLGILSETSPGSVCEIGCGTGQATIRLAAVAQEESN